MTHTATNCHRKPRSSAHLLPVPRLALPLLAGLLMAGSITSYAQSAPAPISAIPPKAFYKAALRDRAPIAPFQTVATWVQEGSVVLLDLRSAHEFGGGHIKGAISFPATELTDAALSKVIASKSTRVVIYCANNLNMATRRVALTTLAYPTLKQLGYTNVQELESAAPGKFPLPLQTSDGSVAPQP